MILVGALALLLLISTQDFQAVEAEGHADLGLALASAGRREEAEAHYREALEIRPTLIAAQQGRANVLLENGDTLAALALFQQSVAQNPRNSTLRKNLALALHRAEKSKRRKPSSKRHASSKTGNPRMSSFEPAELARGFSVQRNQKRM